MKFENYTTREIALMATLLIMFLSSMTLAVFAWIDYNKNDNQEQLK